ncbi:MAG: hypothetical protein ACNA7Y_02170 [Gammaproteobacteria bacterium]
MKMFRDIDMAWAYFREVEKAKDFIEKIMNASLQSKDKQSKDKQSKDKQSKDKQIKDQFNFLKEFLLRSLSTGVIFNYGEKDPEKRKKNAELFVGFTIEALKNNNLNDPITFFQGTQTIKVRANESILLILKESSLDKSPVFWKILEVTLVDLMLENYDEEYVLNKNKNIVLSSAYSEGRSIIYSFNDFEENVISIAQQRGIKNEKGLKKFFTEMREFVEKKDFEFKKKRLYEDAKKTFSSNFIIATVIAAFILIFSTLLGIGGVYVPLGSLFITTTLVIRRKKFIVEEVSLKLTVPERGKLAVKLQNEVIYHIKKIETPKKSIKENMPKEAEKNLEKSIKNEQIKQANIKIPDSKIPEEEEGNRVRYSMFPEREKVKTKGITNESLVNKKDENLEIKNISAPQEVKIIFKEDKDKSNPLVHSFYKVESKDNHINPYQFFGFDKQKIHLNEIQERNKFTEAAQKGLCGPTGEIGCKKLKAVKNFTHEFKIANNPARIFAKERDAWIVETNEEGKVTKMSDKPISVYSGEEYRKKGLH